MVIKSTDGRTPKQQEIDEVDDLIKQLDKVPNALLGRVVSKLILLKAMLELKEDKKISIIKRGFTWKS